MRYFPILQELFESDSILFMLFGLALAVYIGLILLKTTKKNLIALLIMLAVYAACEILSDVGITMAVGLFLLFIGTVAIGGVLGFLIGLIIARCRRR